MQQLFFPICFAILLQAFVQTHSTEALDSKTRIITPLSPIRSPISLEVEPDSRTLEQIYEAAVKELGNESIVIYAGGDHPRQSDYHKIAFEKAFPPLKMELIIDFSKVHNGRIDHQIHTNSVKCDVIQLQTLHDFPRWKGRGALLPYKPLGWNEIHHEFKDPEGYYTGLLIYAFSNNINTQLIPNPTKWPTEARDYLQPQFKNKLIMTYPNDDDAVLFLFKQIVDKYGIEYFHSLVAQNVTWVRGTQVPKERVAAGEFLATMTSGGSLAPIPGQATFVLPKQDPFVMWAQLAAIMKDAPHPEAAKLYFSWMVSKEKQSSGTSFSVRTDVESPRGFLKPWEYINGNPSYFKNFMSDRKALEKFKEKIAQIIGEPIGPNPNGYLGSHPIVALP